MKVKQGYIYTARFNPSDNGGLKKHRPCLIVQNNILNDLLTTHIVVPISSKISNEEVIHEINIEEPFLTQKSTLLLNRLLTLDRKRLKKELGRLNVDSFAKVQAQLPILFEEL